MSALVDALLASGRKGGVVSLAIAGGLFAITLVDYVSTNGFFIALPALALVFVLIGVLLVVHGNPESGDFGKSAATPLDPGFEHTLRNSARALLRVHTLPEPARPALLRALRGLHRCARDPRRRGSSPGDHFDAVTETSGRPTHRSTTAPSESRVTGLARKSVMPASRQASRLPDTVLAVSAMRGITIPRR